MSKVPRHHGTENPHYYFIDEVSEAIYGEGIFDIPLNLIAYIVQIAFYKLKKELCTNETGDHLGLDRVLKIITAIPHEGYLDVNHDYRKELRELSVDLSKNLHKKRFTSDD